LKYIDLKGQVIMLIANPAALLLIVVLNKWILTA